MDSKILAIIASSVVIITGISMIVISFRYVNSQTMAMAHDEFTVTAMLEAGTYKVEGKGGFYYAGEEHTVFLKVYQAPTGALVHDGPFQPWGNYVNIPLSGTYRIAVEGASLTWPRQAQTKTLDLYVIRETYPFAYLTIPGIVAVIVGILMLPVYFFAKKRRLIARVHKSI